MVKYSFFSCFSNVGKIGGKQTVSLGLWWQHQCKEVSTIVHELGHVVGFWHEHSRPDRDQYIRINWDNIHWSRMFNFNKLPTKEIDSMNVSYDYRSIMHYESQVSRYCIAVKSILCS